MRRGEIKRLPDRVPTAAKDLRWTPNGTHDNLERVHATEKL